MPLQITRLLTLFVAIVILFLIAKHFLVPDSFGEFGFYRGKALEEVAAKDIKYVGTETCAECHDDIMELKNTGLHGHLTCEVCHGPGSLHINTAEIADIKLPKGRDHCGKCHSQNMARSVNAVLQVNLSEHNINNNCTDCHNPHEPWQLKEIEQPGENL